MACDNTDSIKKSSLTPQLIRGDLLGDLLGGEL